MFKIVVMSSSGGGNFDVVARERKDNNYCVSKLVVDRDCGAIDVASKYNIDCQKLDRKDEDFHKKTMAVVDDDTDLIVLCGWLSVLSGDFVRKWNHRIINMHPSLLPLYGGAGMYGVHVHEAVMQNREEYTGVTVHYVDESIDGGEIIMQKKIKVDYNLTPYEMGGKVFQLENQLIIEAIKFIMAEYEQR